MGKLVCTWGLDSYSCNEVIVLVCENDIGEWVISVQIQLPDSTFFSIDWKLPKWFCTPYRGRESELPLDPVIRKLTLRMRDEAINEVDMFRGTQKPAPETT